MDGRRCLAHQSTVPWQYPGVGSLTPSARTLSTELLLKTLLAEQETSKYRVESVSPLLGEGSKSEFDFDDLEPEGLNVERTVSGLVVMDERSGGWVVKRTA